MAKRVVTTADVLNGYVVLDLECLDRIHLNGYVPNLQVGGQVVQFLASRGFPIPSPVLVGRIGDGFRRAVRSFADSNQIPLIKSGKGDRKIEVMRPYLARQEVTGRSGVAAIGWAQEFQRVATCTITEPGTVVRRISAGIGLSGGSPAITFTSGMSTSGRRLSRSAPTSRIRSRSG